MIYLLIGDSRFDYELKNIIFGIYTNKEKAKENKKQLEKKQKENNNTEIELYIKEEKINSLNEKNIKYYIEN